METVFKRIAEEQITKKVKEMAGNITGIPAVKIIEITVYIKYNCKRKQAVKS